jgi:hypothetical protein
MIASSQRDQSTGVSGPASPLTRNCRSACRWPWFLRYTPGHRYSDQGTNLSGQKPPPRLDYGCHQAALTRFLSPQLSELVAPKYVLLNSQFLWPITNGLIGRSLRFLSSSSRPSCKNTRSFSYWLRQEAIAAPSVLLCRTRSAANEAAPKRLSHSHGSH